MAKVKNNQPPPSKGVLHKSLSDSRYNLEKCLPIEPLRHVVEQYWLVSWDLGQHNHTQENLPDPSVNLVFNHSGCVLYGPVSKKFSYQLKSKGCLFGIKFTPAGYTNFHQNIQELVDQQLSLTSWFNLPFTELSHSLKHNAPLNKLAKLIENTLLQQEIVSRKKIRQANAIVHDIKSNGSILDVNQISRNWQLTPRSLQRLFKECIGLTPKQVIDKYRMHEVLAEIENGNTHWQDIAFSMGYTDQPHFINVFKKFVGKSPNAYVAHKEP